MYFFELGVTDHVFDPTIKCLQIPNPIEERYRMLPWNLGC